MIEVRGTFNEVLEIDADELVSLAFNDESDFWYGPTGMATVCYRAGENEWADLHLFSTVGVGLVLRYEGYDVLMLKAGEPGCEGTIAVHPAGSKWDVPCEFFVSRETALKAVRHFFETGRCNDDNWLTLDKCGPLGEGAGC